MGPIGGMVLGAMAAPAGAGLAGTLAAGAKGLMGSNPLGAAITGAMGGGGLAGAAKGLASSNPIMSAVMSGAGGSFSPSNLVQGAKGMMGMDSPSDYKTLTTVNATPTQSYAGAVDPKVLWSDMHNVGFNDAQSAALLGNMKQESEFRPGVLNPGEGAQGLIQWRGARLANLKNFAAAQGKPYTDHAVQVQFLKHEMQTTEAGPGQAFLSATTPDAANAALKGYIRYGSPPDKGGIVTRQQNTDNFYKQFTGQPITAGVGATPATGTATIANSGTQAQPATQGQKFADALKAEHAKALATPVAAPAGAPAVQGGNIAAGRQEALLNPAQQLLDQLKQRALAGAGAAPMVGGKSPVSI